MASLHNRIVSDGFNTASAPPQFHKCDKHFWELERTVHRVTDPPRKDAQLLI
jgi:hypothetical protein